MPKINIMLSNINFDQENGCVLTNLDKTLFALFLANMEHDSTVDKGMV